MMGDEADVDWQEGLIEWGIEDTENWMLDKLYNVRPNLLPLRKRKSNKKDENK